MVAARPSHRLPFFASSRPVCSEWPANRPAPIVPIQVNAPPIDVQKLFVNAVYIHSGP